MQERYKQSESILRSIHSSFRTGMKWDCVGFLFVKHIPWIKPLHLNFLPLDMYSSKKFPFRFTTINNTERLKDTHPHPRNQLDYSEPFLSIFRQSSMFTENLTRCSDPILEHISLVAQTHFPVNAISSPHKRTQFHPYSVEPKFYWWLNPLYMYQRRTIFHNLEHIDSMLIS